MTAWGECEWTARDLLVWDLASFDVARILYPYLCEPKQEQIRRAIEAVEDVAA